MAGTTISNIPELLEMILVDVDIKTHSSSLAHEPLKAFQSSIAESKKLQTKLFMRMDKTRTPARQSRSTPYSKNAKNLRGKT